MKYSLRRIGFGVSALVVVLLTNTGCGHAGNSVPLPANANQTRQQNMNARLQAVQDNPNIPQEDKARITATLQAQMAGSNTKGGDR